MPGYKEPEIEERRSSRQEPGQERHHSGQLVPPAEPRGTVGSVELKEDVDDCSARAGAGEREDR
jgi:hypothetical protein